MLSFQWLKLPFWALLSGLPWIYATCPKAGKDDFYACQTDVALGGATAPLPLEPSSSAACSSNGGCAALGLLTGECCPASNGQYLSCCDKQDRRLFEAANHSRRLTAQAMQKKGVTIDDTTLRWCSSRIPETWPNLEAAPMGSLRIFQTWTTQWPEEGRHAAWEGLVKFVKAKGVKVLVGTPVTCLKGDDEKTWGWTKEFLAMVGPKHVMGLAIGNELELLHNHADAACVAELFSGGRLWSTFVEHVAEFDRMGFSGIPVTSVFTASILTDRVQVPFMEDPKTGLVNSFLLDAIRKYGRRYAFTFNVYPYFDPGIHLNPGTTDKCSLDLPRVICWDQANCLGPNIMAAARRQMMRLTGRRDDLFWIGEIGWSSPRAEALGTAMADCEEFSSLETFQTFYNGYLQWNLQVPGTLAGPDHAFYFTLRDALNFGQQEHFGLLVSCQSLGCKVAKPSFRAEICPLPQPAAGMTWQGWAFVALGVFLAVIIAFTCLYVRSPKIKKFVDSSTKRTKPRRLAEVELEGSSSSSE